MNDYDVKLENGNMQDLYIRFEGPENTPYSGGSWRVHVELPDEYPYKSPSICFVDPIIHPNIDEKSGSICLDDITQTWSPIYSLLNVFEILIPVMLSCPNPSDALNEGAAALLMQDPVAYKSMVEKHVAENAMKDPIKDAIDVVEDENESEHEMSSVGEFDSEGDE